MKYSQSTVEGGVDPSDEPAEQPFVQRLGDGVPRLICLAVGLESHYFFSRERGLRRDQHHGQLLRVHAQ